MERCSAPDFVTIAGILFACLAMSWLALRHVCEEHQLAQALDVPGAPSDIDWSSSSKYRLVALGFVGGLLAGWLGMGGGILYNPIMLKLGMDPQVVSATSMFIVMFVTLSSVPLFVVAGLMEFSYAGALAAMTVVITYVCVV